MIALILRLFDLLAPLIRLLDVDYPQFRAILETKLILDSRRRSSVVQAEAGGKPRASQENQRQPRTDAGQPIIAQPARRPKKAKNMFGAMLFFYGIMGLMLASTLAMASPVAGTALIHSFVMVMVGLSLVADFSSVLLDTTDNAILQPRPVSGRTVLVARVAHIAVYLATLSLSLSLGPMIIETIKLGPAFPLIYLPTLACSVVLMVFVANLLYLLAVGLVSGERFRDLILYVQIGLSVVLFGSFNLMPRLMDAVALGEWRLEGHSWLLYLLPPVWMAAPVDLLLAGHAGGLQLGLSLLVVAAPLGGLLAVVFVFAPRFNRALLKLEAEPAAGVAEKGRPASVRPGLGSRLGRLLCRQRAERAVFELIWIMCGRDRQFKHRTYPSVALALVLAFSMILKQETSGQGLTERLHAASQTQTHLLVLYMACFMVPSTLLQLRFSPQYQAAWLYEALPIARPGVVMVAALKAVLARFVLPAYVIIGTVVAAVWGQRCAWDLVFAAGAIVFISTLEAAYLARALPFSEAFGAMEGSSRMGKSMALMIIPGAIGGFHYWWGSNRAVLAGAFVLMLVLTWLLGRRYGGTNWEALRRP
jgi:ABC-2 type transport system permease protein